MTAGAGVGTAPTEVGEGKGNSDGTQSVPVSQHADYVSYFKMMKVIKSLSQYLVLYFPQYQSNINLNLNLKPL